MKKWWCALLAAVLLTGCGGQKDLETVGDFYIVPQVPAASRIWRELPEDATMLTMESDTEGTLYLCRDYTVTVQTLTGGDLDSTLRKVTGFGKEELTVYSYRQNGLTRHACVWAAAGEGTDQVGKAVILDDGIYHYAVAVLVPSEQAGEQEESIRQLLDSVQLE